MSDRLPRKPPEGGTPCPNISGQANLANPRIFRHPPNAPGYAYGLGTVFAVLYPPAMAFDDYLAERVRGVLGKQRGITEKKMFGGLGFMLHGNMVCGIVGEKLMLRLGEAGAKEALAQEHVAPMDFTGKPIKTMAYVEPAGVESEADLARWVAAALAFAKTLPPK